MEIMYWRFPHLKGVWSVIAGKPNRMQSTEYFSGIDVEWELGIPYNQCKAGLRLPEQSSKAQEINIKAHYAKLAIEPFEYSMKNGLDAMQHTIVKYVTRFRDKGGIRDLEAARTTIDQLIQYEKNKTNATN